MNTTTTTTTAATKRSSTLYMVELAMMIAIILLMSFTPLGYLRTPGLSITLLTIPVAVGAIILGPKGGAVCGLAFGATSFYMAVTGSSAFAAALFNINPFGTFIVCIVARVLEGWITGLIFAALYKSPAKKFSYYVASLACPLLNTFFFMGFLCLFFYNTDYIQGIVSSLSCCLRCCFCGRSGTDRSGLLLCSGKYRFPSTFCGTETCIIFKRTAVYQTTLTTLSL